MKITHSDSLFKGLSAFPLSPVRGAGDVLDEAAFVGLVRRLVEARVDSITVLGSTGAYPYLSGAQRDRVAELAVEHAGDIPVIVGVGATSTVAVLRYIDAAQRLGAAGVLLAPVSYQPLTASEVFDLYADVDRELSVPFALYDNPGTTGFTFTDHLYRDIARLPNAGSIKIPPTVDDAEVMRERVAAVRAVIPSHVTIGISGDGLGALGLASGCDAWFSAIGGTLPEPVMRITRATQRGDIDAALAESTRLDPLWQLFAQHGGSYRVIATIAEILGLTSEPSVPRPVRALRGSDRDAVRAVVESLDLG